MAEEIADLTINDYIVLFEEVSRLVYRTEHRNVSDVEELSLMQERLQLTINELLYMQLNSNGSTISNIAVDEIIQNLTVLLEQIRRDLIPGTNPNLAIFIHNRFSSNNRVSQGRPKYDIKE